MRISVSVRLLVGVIVLMTACGSSVGSDQAEQGTSHETGLRTDGLYGSCGGVRFDQLPPDTSAFTGFQSWSDVNLAPLEGEGPFFGEFVDGYDWFVADRSEGSWILFGQPTAAQEDPPYAYALLELREGNWTPVGWGQCRIELAAEGWGNARFVVAGRPDPNSERISVLATEVACAGGLPPRDREVRAVVLDENDESVSVVILVEPSRGATTCQGNPAFEFDVQLDSPLGQRGVLDASVHPPAVVWPR